MDNKVSLTVLSVYMYYESSRLFFLFLNFYIIYEIFHFVTKWKFNIYYEVVD